MIDLNPNLADVIESAELAPGLIREEFLDGTVIAYRFSRHSMTLLNVMKNDVRKLLRKRGTTLPFLIIYDVGKLNFLYTIPSHLGLQFLSKVRPEIKGRIALKLPKNLVTLVVYIFMRTTHNPHRPRRVFFSDEKALNWLLGVLPKFG